MGLCSSNEPEFDYRSHQSNVDTRELCFNHVPMAIRGRVTYDSGAKCYRDRNGGIYTTSGYRSPRN